jgi:acyl-CoA synthetase (AMP-forming)/AMP-acid ligase II
VGPNLAFDLCAQKITAEQRATLDLSTWVSAINGAEPVRAETLARFAEVFAPCGFRQRAFTPSYGLAEATLMVTGGRKPDAPHSSTFQAAALEQHRVVAADERAADTRTLVSCGRVLDDTSVVIVQPDTLRRCAADEVGEIWVAGPSVARGYWNRPAETQHTFHAYLAGGTDGPFLRTGDLGFLQDGALYVTGRLKDLIIIAGANHYPQDIELTAEQSHPALRASCAAAFTVETEGQERLVVAIEVERRWPKQTDEGEAASARAAAAEIATAIRRAVAEAHELQVHQVLLLKAGSIPKTSSGKIQRQTCRRAFLEGSLVAWDDCV